VRIVSRLLAAVQFLTVLPVPKRAVEEETLPASMPYFPVVGALMGAALAGADQAFQLVLSARTAALLDVVLLGGLTGALHLDGLADAADAFGSRRDRSGMLAVMKDSRIGAIGAVAVVCVLLLKWEFIAELSGGLRLVALAVAPLVGRCGQVMQAGMLGPAGAQGSLGAVFAGKQSKLAVGLACLLPLAAAGALWFPEGFVLGGLAVLFLLAGIGYIRRRLGGATGDTMGALTEASEAFTLGAALLMQRLT